MKRGRDGISRGRSSKGGEGEENLRAYVFLNERDKIISINIENGDFFFFGVG